MATLLTEADVERLIDMDSVIGAVDRSMRELAAGTAENVPRRRTHPPGGSLSVMFASFPGCGYYGLKSYSVQAGKVRFLVVLYASAGERAGNVEALIEANLLGAYRTGAATGVAARALANPGPVEVGVIGAGWQARTQIHALSRTLPVTRFHVYSRDTDRRQRFADELSRELDAQVSPAASAEEAVRGCQVVVTMTSAGQPVLEADWVEPGALVVGAGSNIPTKAELPAALVARAGLVVVDQLEAARLESGDLLVAERAGQFSWAGTVELGAVLTGAVEGRPSRESIVLFESHGLALWDVAAGAQVLEQARAAGLGTEVPLFAD
ncbi:MAG: ornithine cyclodeaminase family protein [Candidatus Dormibacteraeota bacterium]|nr:ornithine cyclodeaminase family protein [Candidatus Dormibacteraeota bacterium]